MGTGLLPYHVGLDTDSLGVQAYIRMCLYTSRVTCQYEYSHTCGCLATSNNNSIMYVWLSCVEMQYLLIAVCDDVSVQ